MPTTFGSSPLQITQTPPEKSDFPASELCNNRSVSPLSTFIALAGEPAPAYLIHGRAVSLPQAVKINRTHILVYRWAQEATGSRHIKQNLRLRKSDVSLNNYPGGGFIYLSTLWGSHLKGYRFL